MSKAWHDRPLTPMQTAVFWIEYAARNPDLTFRTLAADVPLYQYLNLDIALVFLVFGAVVLLVIKVIKWFRKKTAPKVVKNNNKKKQS